MVGDETHPIPPRRRAGLIAAGFVAGIGSGLLGVGGGTIIVPLLVGFLGLSQHRAHATSLAAIVPIAAVGAAVFGAGDAVDYELAGLLAAGALVGAPLGARLMAATRERLLGAAFGVLLVAVGAVMLLR
ncbi:MAG: sulfite exporter TauE/SafE family protein [Actinomycetota bacterium]|nr:sulfite exporter TauE/SafE family protein [Actinomycetota bacterium]